jgi:predicted nucleic acid-binding protein
MLIIDASLLLRLRKDADGDRGTNHARIFIRRLTNEALNGTIECYSPILTPEECYFKIIQVQYEKEASRRSGNGVPINWHRLYKAEPVLIRTYMQEVKDFRRIVRALPVLPLEPEDIADSKTPHPSIEERMLHFTDAAPTLPKDAYLLAVAERLNCVDIATMDRDFHTIANLNIYSIP